MKTEMPSHELLGDFPVVICVPLQWGDEDAYGHVNNTIHLRWAETARVEYLMRIGAWQRSIATAAGPILASISCDYRFPLTFPDTVYVGARVTAIGNSSLKMAHAIVSANHQKIAAEVDSTIVLFDYPNNRTARIPEHVRDAIKALEGRELPPPEKPRH
jgi:acyl-CoA thioester hydrolase